MARWPMRWISNCAGMEKLRFSTIGAERKNTRRGKYMSSDQVREHGRILPVVLHDRQSEARTPAEPLSLIPETAKDPYSPQMPLPFLRRLEEDLTRLAPGRPQADGQPVVITGAIFDEDLRPVRDSLIEVW